MSTRPRGRPRTFDRAKALATAMEAFWRRGYEGVSVSELTRLMKINAPSLYAAFGNKEGLFREALELYATTHGAFATRALAEEPTARGAVERMLREAVRAYAAPGMPRGCLLIFGAANCAPGDEAAAQAARARRLSVTRVLEQRLRRAHRDGELPHGADPQALAAFFAATLQGISQQSRDGASPETLHEIARLALLAWPAPERARAASRGTR